MVRFSVVLVGEWELFQVLPVCCPPSKICCFMKANRSVVWGDVLDLYININIHIYIYVCIYIYGASPNVHSSKEWTFEGVVA